MGRAADPVVRNDGVVISICLLPMPWMAIWPAALPRMEATTTRR